MCEYRKLKCHSCGEITKTLADVEKTTARMEAEQVNVEKSIQIKFTNLNKNLETYTKNTDMTMKNNTARMETQMANVGMKIVNMKTDIKGRLKAVNNEVKD